MGHSGCFDDIAAAAIIEGTRLGEVDVSSCSVEQPEAHGLFKIGNASRQSRLWDAEDFGGARKAFYLGDLNKQGHVAQRFVHLLSHFWNTAIHLDGFILPINRRRSTSRIHFAIAASSKGTFCMSAPSRRTVLKATLGAAAGLSIPISAAGKETSSETLK